MGNTALLSIENMTVRYGKDIALQIESPISIEKGDRVGINLLLAHNMDYTRSSTDIEMIYTNAKRAKESGL